MCVGVIAVSLLHHPNDNLTLGRTKRVALVVPNDDVAHAASSNDDKTVESRLQGQLSGSVERHVLSARLGSVGVCGDCDAIGVGGELQFAVSVSVGRGTPATCDEGGKASSNKLATDAPHVCPHNQLDRHSTLTRACGYRKNICRTNPTHLACGKQQSEAVMGDVKALENEYDIVRIVPLYELSACADV